MQRTNDISVVIVHYGHGDEVFKCLDSLARIREKIKLRETILVDNNEEKTEKSKILRNYNWVTYIPTSHNLGLAGGRNLGFRRAKGEYIFLLDSDVTIDAISFESLYKEIKKSSRRGIVSPHIKNISGSWFGCATLELTPLTGIFYLSFLKKLFPENPIIKKHLISSWDRKTSRNVETIQIGACMIRREALKEIGGFDEALFLYFGEEDISKRLREKGWKLYLDSKSEAIHLESKWTPKNTERIRNIWSRNRFHYFRKHYGIISAFVVEAFARISLSNISLLAILLLGFFLRIYKLNETYAFGGEQGRELLDVINIIKGTRSFLIGPPTSHPWLYFGPLYYWILAIILPILKFNLLTGAWLGVLAGTAVIVINYYFIEKVSDRKVAIISSLIIAVSPLWIKFARDARFFSFVLVPFYPFLYSLFNIWHKKRVNLFFVGFVFGIFFHFHYSPVILVVPLLILIWLRREFFNLKAYLKLLSGFVLSLSPLLIYDFNKGFKMTTSLIMWFPYRVLGFLGVIDRNNFTFASAARSLGISVDFISKTFINNNNLRLLIVGIFITILVNEAFRVIKGKGNFLEGFSVLTFFSGIVAIIIHGDAPIHYYLPLFPVVVILVSFYIARNANKVFWKGIFLGIFLLLLTSNVLNFVSSKEFYAIRSEFDIKDEVVPLAQLEGVVDAIIADANGRDFKLIRVGPNDQFEGNFSGNYRYLMWLNGNMPKQEATLSYTIYEDPTGINPSTCDYKWVRNILLYKNENQILSSNPTNELKCDNSF